MFERNALKKKEGEGFFINTEVLKIIGLIFSMIGTFGISVVQNNWLNLSAYTNETLLEAMKADSSVMTLSTIAICLNSVYYMGIPLFAYLLEQGFRHTSDLKKYGLRLLLCAVISEPFYDFAMSGSLLDMSVQNPVFSLCLSLAMLYLFRQFSGGGFKKTLIKILIGLGALLWILLIKCESGIYYVMLAAIFYFWHGDETWSILAGIAATLKLFPAPLTFFLLHFHDGYRKVPQKKTRLAFYVLYPVQLLVIGILGKVL